MAVASGPGSGVILPVAVMLVVSPPFPTTTSPSALIRLLDQFEV
jgi:hypothetical protein